MAFKTPLVLCLLPIVLSVLFIIKARERRANFRFSSALLLKGLPLTWKVRFQFIPSLLRLITLMLLVVALAGPRLVLSQTQVKAEGIDIVLAIDISSSMLAEDFTVEGKRLNRLEIVKDVVGEFIQSRLHDRIGFVAFASLAYTVVPLTTDNSWLLQNLERLDIGLIKDGTAVGSAIAASVSRLKNSEAKSKIVILLTDGVNNAGEIDPVSAARAAQSFGIKIYTIGAGSKGNVPFPAQDIFGRKVYQSVRIDIDDETLGKIAEVTGGRYFRATDTESLRKVYQEIDRLEKTKIDEIGFTEYEELFGRFVAAALLLLAFELVLSRTVLLRIP
jgi:Ca-activated chloride channel family protein